MNIPRSSLTTDAVDIPQSIEGYFKFALKNSLKAVEHSERRTIQLKISRYLCGIILRHELGQELASHSSGSSSSLQETFTSEENTGVGQSVSNLTNEDSKLHVFCLEMAAKVRDIDDVGVQLEVVQRTQTYMKRMIKKNNADRQRQGANNEQTVLNWLASCNDAGYSSNDSKIDIEST